MMARKRKASSPLIDFVANSSWALHRPVFDALLSIVGRHLDGEKLSADAIGVIVAQRDAEHPIEDQADVQGGVAVIPITGVLAKRSSMVNGLSQPQGSSVERIAADLRAALDNPDVSSIVLNVDSPGGSVDGIDGLASAIAAANKQKPVTAFANGQMASAAYYLASQAGRIVATSDADVGSIGVYAVAQDWSRRAKNAGVETHVIRPGKHKGAGIPGAPISNDQLDAWQSNVDAYYQLFVDAVSRGRSMGHDKVLELADGRTWVGQQAVDVGLVDAVGTLDGLLGSNSTSGRTAAAEPRARSDMADVGDLSAPGADFAHSAESSDMDKTNGATPPSGGAPPAGPSPMTLDALRAQHPDLVATIAAEGHKKGVAEERARLGKLFKACPDAHRETFGSMIESGCSVEDGLMGFLADQRRLKDNRLERIERAGGKPLGADTDRAETTSEPQFANDDERYKAEFERLGGDVDGQRRNAVEIRQEFGDLKFYAAYQKARSMGAIRGGR